MPKLLVHRVPSDRVSFLRVCEVAPERHGSLGAKDRGKMGFSVRCWGVVFRWRHPTK